MKTKHSSRDAGIEFARIIGCLIVIGVHISLSDYQSGVYDMSRGFINTLVADGVAIFWLITGCFLFRTAGYKKVLVRTGRSIALPVAVFSLVCLHFSGWLISGQPLAESITHTPQAYWEGLKKALALQPAIPHAGHLWYCCAYMLVILAFPLLRAFAVWMQEEERRENTFLVLSFAMLVLNDFSKNAMLTFSHHGLNAAVPAAIEILWGHVLYRRRETLLAGRRRLAWLLGAPVVFVMLNAARTLAVRHTGSKAILYWYSGIGLLCAISVVLFCLALCRRVKPGTVASGLITGVGGCTFLIYLVHLPLRDILYRYEIHTRCFAKVSQMVDGALGEMLYTAIMLLAVFAVSLPVSVLLRLTARMCGKGFALLKRRPAVREDSQEPAKTNV